MNGAALWSVHDITPDSIGRGERVVGLLADAGIHPVCILITPSGCWTPSMIQTLRRWERGGNVLAAHGWTHRARPPRGVYHRMHSLLLSRDVAEHLGSTRTEGERIAARCARWFGEVGLAPPAMYVPPAWALGSTRLKSFHDGSYQWVETLTGVYSVGSRRFVRLPLVGFEADTPARAVALRAANTVNLALARATGGPLRVAVHPRDLELFLSADLRRVVSARPLALHPSVVDSI